MQGDVIVHLEEAAAEELSQPAAQLSMPRLQSLLELAVRTSSLGQVWQRGQGGACQAGRARQVYVYVCTGRP